MAEGATTEEEIPQALRSRPSLSQFQYAYWDFYSELSGSRQYTASGVAEIPYGVKLLWLDENWIYDQDERNDYMQMIGLLDSTFLENYHERTKVK